MPNRPGTFFIIVQTKIFSHNLKNENLIIATNSLYWFEEYFRIQKLSDNSRISSANIQHLDGKFATTYKQIDENNRLSIIRYHLHYRETFTFSGNSSNTLLGTFYINNIELFDIFILYFEEQMEKILNNYAKKEIKFPPNKKQTKKNIHQKYKHDTDFIKLAIENIKPQKYTVKARNIEITKREIECVALFQAGYTAKESAKILGLSFRTIEKYFDTMKDKLNCLSKRDVLKLLIADGLTQNVLRSYLGSACR